VHTPVWSTTFRVAWFIYEGKAGCQLKRLETVHTLSSAILVVGWTVWRGTTGLRKWVQLYVSNVISGLGINYAKYFPHVLSEIFTTSWQWITNAVKVDKWMPLKCVFLKPLMKGKTELKKVKVKLSLCFKLAPRHENVLGERKYGSKHSWPRH
jgi:hypothetical protein